MAAPSESSQVTPFDDAPMASILSTLTNAYEVCLMMHPSADCTDFLWQDHDGGAILLEQAGGTSAVDTLIFNPAEERQ